MKKLTKEEFIIKAIKIHGNKYDYSKVEYINLCTKITIICDSHGEFEQIPNNHLKGGCKKCSFKLKTNTLINFINQANKIHNYIYDYSLCNYINCNEKINILCKSCNIYFLQKPYKHLTGQGCPKCCKAGYSKKEWIKFCIKKI